VIAGGIDWLLLVGVLSATFA